MINYLALFTCTLLKMCALLRKFFREYFTDYFTNLSALSHSLISAGSIFMSGYHHFVQKQALIQTLYGHLDSNERADFTVSGQEATQAVKKRLKCDRSLV